MTMRLAVCMTTQPDVYSGGRYSGLALAEVAALAGYNTWFVVNNRPIFFDDWATSPAHSALHLQLTPDFKTRMPDGDFDVVVLVPGTGMPGFYDRVQSFAIERGAHLVIIDFESGDWFNRLSPYSKPLSEWHPWIESARYASLILSISEEGKRWAKPFYAHSAPHVRHAVSYPPVNVFAADSVAESCRENRIVLFMRFTASMHKGSSDLVHLFDESMYGYTLVFLLGKDVVPASTLRVLSECAARSGVALEFRYKLTDRQKFAEIKRAKLILFPSLFEGFGYPPVESLYCGTPCVAFELPVLRETCGDGLVYAPHNNWDAFRQKTREALARDWDPNTLRAAVARVTDVGSLATNLRTTFDSMVASVPPGGASERAHYARRLRLRDRLRLNDLPSRKRALRQGAKRVLRSVANGTLRILHGLRPRTRRVTYWPAFADDCDFVNHYYRACWYLPHAEGSCERVVMGRASGLPDAPGPIPSEMMPPADAPTHILIARTTIGLLVSILLSDLVVFWKCPPKKQVHRILNRLLGIKMQYVNTNDVNAVEFGTYARLVWDHLVPPEEQRRVISENRERFNQLAGRIREENSVAAAVFGTGPSLQRAIDFDWSDVLCVVCNSIVQNQELLDHIRPRFICAGDAVSHFGISRYAEKFRQDLAYNLRKRDLYFLTTAPYGHLFLQHFPDLGGRTFLIEHGQSELIFDLVAEYSLPRLDSTLNIHMLPLAATFANKIFLLGCDGKAPQGDNEDFWSHANAAQYHELVDTGHKCHPTFDRRRQTTTYDRYLRSVETTMEAGERKGIQYFSLARSYVQPIHVREIINDHPAIDGFSRPFSIRTVSERLYSMLDGK